MFLQIRDSDVDILCLQEAIRVDIQREIYESLLATYPYILSAVDLSAPFSMYPQPACAVADLQLYGACIQTECPLTDLEALLVCFAIRYCCGYYNK